MPGFNFEKPLLTFPVCFWGTYLRLEPCIVILVPPPVPPVVGSILVIRGVLLRSYVKNPVVPVVSCV